MKMYDLCMRRWFVKVCMIQTVLACRSSECTETGLPG
jgi:hypothetical protein